MTTTPISSIIDSPFLPTHRLFPEDNSQLLITLTSSYTEIAHAVNFRDVAQYERGEIPNGQSFFTTTTASQSSNNPRLGFRKVFALGATAAGATTTIAHGITGFTQFTRIYGTCITAIVDYRPIPYASATAVNQQIEIKVDATNISVINGAAAPNISSGIVVLEYLKS